MLTRDPYAPIHQHLDSAAAAQSWQGELDYLDRAISELSRRRAFVMAHIALESPRVERCETWGTEYQRQQHPTPLPTLVDADPDIDLGEPTP